MHSSQTHAIVDGVDVSVKRMGQGIPVLCLHATGHDAGDFTLLAARMHTRCEFICLEWPGHGDSGADPIAASAIRYAELAGGVVRELHLQPSVVIGNSIGGAAAILYAQKHPLDALVLCDSGGLVKVDGVVRAVCRLFEKLFAAGERDAWWYRKIFAGYYRMVLPAPAAAAQRKHIVDHAQARARVLREAWVSFGKPEADIRQIAQTLTLPIWIAWAKKDRVIPLARCRAAIEKLKNFRLDTFDAGHAAFLEQPDEFAAKFSNFLDTMSQQKSATHLAA